ncbi:hypothetical protein D3C87_1136980 [compost metagenome]
MAIGIKPSEGTSAVIKTARSFDLVACITMRFTSVQPSFFKRLNSETSNIPFKTATPNSAIKPTPAEMLKGKSRIHKANMPPMADRGIAV